MGKVTILRVLTTLDVPIDRVLEGALAAELEKQREVYHRDE